MRTRGDLTNWCPPVQFRLLFFFFNDTATTEIYTLSLHDALPISTRAPRPSSPRPETRRRRCPARWRARRSEEHTSELQSQSNLVCRLLLEKKKKPAITQPPLLTTHNTRAEAHGSVTFEQRALRAI